ncbi:ankyrin repeat domain-containing protein [Chlamydiales bacterium]|nr:ankyrin repeat domain-containing protein [Chlamydiales bacterium]
MALQIVQRVHTHENSAPIDPKKDQFDQLISSVFSRTLESLIHFNSDKPHDFVTSNEVVHFDLTQLVDQNIRKLLQNISREIPHPLQSGSAWLVTKGSLDEISEFYTQHRTTLIIPSQIELQLEKELPKLSLRNFIDKFNQDTGLSKRGVYIREAKRRFYENQVETWEIVRGRKINPFKEKISDARMNLLELYKIKNQEVQELALLELIDLLENDPIERESSFGLIELIKDLKTMHPAEVYDGIDVHLQRLVIKSMAISLIILQFHYNTKILSSVSDTLKNDIQDIISGIENFNTHKDLEIKHYVNLAIQAADRVQTDLPKWKEIAGRVFHLVKAGVAIATIAINPNPEGAISGIDGISREIIAAFDGLVWQDEWFDNAIFIKSLSRASMNKYTLFRHIISIFRRQKENEKQSNPDLLYECVTYLEHIAIGSFKSRIQIEAMKLLYQYLFGQNAEVKNRAIFALIQIINKGHARVANTAHIILEMIVHNHLNQESNGSELISGLDELLKAKRLHANSIMTSRDYCPQVIIGFIKRVNDIRVLDDNAGATPLNILAASQQSILGMLKVIKLFPALSLDLSDIQGFTFLHHIAKNGNGDLIQDVVDSEVPLAVNAIDRNGDTPLMIAATLGRSKVIEKLLIQKADPNIRNMQGETVMHLAAKSGNIYVLSTLLKDRSIRVNLGDVHGRYPLNRAIEEGNIPIIEMLIKKRAKISENAYRFTSLIVAARLKQWIVVRHFLERIKPQDLEDLEILEIFKMMSTDRKTLTVSHEFIEYHLRRLDEDFEYRKKFSRFQSVPHPFIELFQLSAKQWVLFDQVRLSILDEKKVPHQQKIRPIHLTEVDSGGNTNLHHLAKDKSRDAWNFAVKIIKKGANLTTINAKGFTPIEIAIAFRNTQMIKLFQKHGIKLPEVRFKIRKKEDQIPSLITLLSSKRYSELPPQLDQFKEDEEDPLGCTPLMYLASDLSDDAFEVAKKAIKKIKNLDQKNHFGLTVPIVATCNRNYRFLREISGKADFNLKNVRGFTALHLAAYLLDIEAMKVLIEGGAKLTEENVFKETPLHILCGRDPYRAPITLSYSSVIPSELIPIKGVDPVEIIRYVVAQMESPYKLVDCNRDTILHRAALWGTPAIIDFLSEQDISLPWKRNNQKMLPVEITINGADHNVIRSNLLRKSEEEIDELMEESNTRTFEDLVQYSHAVEVKKVDAFLSKKVSKKMNSHEEEYWEKSRQTKRLGNLVALANLPNILESLFNSKEGVQYEKDGIFGQNPLHVSARCGFHQILNLYIKKNYDITREDNHGNTALHLAALYGHRTFIDLFVKQGKDLHKQPNNDGRLPLHLSVIHGNLDLVTYFIEKLNSDELYSDNQGELPIHIAARYGEEEIFKYLYNRNPGSAKFINDDGQNTLHLAAARGHSKVIRFLYNILDDMSQEEWLDVEVNSWVTSDSIFIDTKDPYGRTALHLAAQGGHVESLKLLILSKASLYHDDDEGETALHRAVYSLQKETVSVLLEADRDRIHDAGGSLIDIEDTQGERALHELFKLVKENGEKNIDERRLAILQSLIESDAEVNHQDYNGNTITHLAMLHGNDYFLEKMVKAVKLRSKDRSFIRFSENVVNFEIKNAEGNTPLHLAAQEGHLNCVEFLLKKKVSHVGEARVTRFFRGRLGPSPSNKVEEPPIFLAARGGHIKVVKLLAMKSDGGIDRTNVNKESILHVVLQRDNLTQNHKEIIKFIARKYPGILVKKDAKKNTLLHVTATYNHVQETDLILSHLPNFGAKNPDEIAQKRSHFVRKKNHSGDTAENIADDKNHLGCLRKIVGYRTKNLGHAFNKKEETSIKTLGKQLSTIQLNTFTSQSEVDSPLW